MKPRKSTTMDVKNSNLDLDLVDRMSDLPDFILGSILSFLPTKESVATSILSKRWKFVWRNVHNIHFSFHDCFKSYLFEERYPEFIDRVLSLLGVGFLNKFTLECDPNCIPSSHVNSWINTALSRNIHELHLCTPYGFPYNFDLPRSVLSCESIRSLELNGINVPTTDVVCLPRLENLKLISSSFDIEEDFEKLISKCPVLNYLYFDLDHIDDGFSGEFTYIISSNSLKRLEMSFDVETHFLNVKLKTSSLEYLKLEGLISEISVQKNLCSLIEADFDINLCKVTFSLEENCNSIVEAIDAFDRAKVLTLSAAATWGENHLDIYHDNDHLTWTAPLEVPRCLSNCLKKIEFDFGFEIDFYYGFGVLEMIRYMLKNGSALEIIHIICRTYNFYRENSVLVQEILKFQKFPVCEVKIL